MAAKLNEEPLHGIETAFLANPLHRQICGPKQAASLPQTLLLQFVQQGSPPRPFETLFETATGHRQRIHDISHVDPFVDIAANHLDGLRYHRILFKNQRSTLPLNDITGGDPADADRPVTISGSLQQAIQQSGGFVSYLLTVEPNTGQGRRGKLTEELLIINPKDGKIGRYIKS